MFGILDGDALARPWGHSGGGGRKRDAAEPLSATYIKEFRYCINNVGNLYILGTTHNPKPIVSPLLQEVWIIEKFFFNRNVKSRNMGQGDRP